MINNESRLIEISEKYARTESHAFLAEGLSTPMLNQTNANRSQMYNSQLSQTIQLDNAELPLVYTGFENQISEYSTGYTKLSNGEDYVVLRKFIKNPCNYILIVKGKNTGTYDVIYRKDAEHLTEEFGYKLNNEVLDELNEGDTIEDNSVLSYDKCFTPNMNFKFGTNAKIAYLPYKGSTNEDGIAVSETFAKEKMSSWFVKKITVNINTNDIPLNLYGDATTYKTFPNVGEQVGKDGKLLATRIISHNTIINKFKDDIMSKTIEGDKPIFVHGNATVIDIDMWNNNRTDILHKERYNTQLAEVHDNLMRYYQEVVDYLMPIVNNPDNKLSSDLVALYNQVASYLDPLSEFERDGSKFDNIVMTFVIAYIQPLNIGSKITARYGNKGVIARIVPDDEMPMLTSIQGKPIKDGMDEKLFRADMCINPFGIMNRLNISQCVEMELNYLKNLVRYNISQMTDIKEKEEYLFKFIKMVDPKLVNYGILKAQYDKFEDKEAFFKQVVDVGFAIMQPPFWNNINGFGVYKIYEEFGFDIEPNNINNNKIPIGELYYIRLKHEPEDKLSARSSDNLNMSGLPTRTGDKKNSKAKISNTPIRIGEMETTNLGMVGSLGPVTDLLMSYANSPTARMNLILSLLTSNPFEIEIKNTKSKDSNNKKILKSYLNALGIKFINDKDPEVALSYNSETSDFIDSLTNKDLLILTAEMEMSGEEFDLAEFKENLDTLRKEYDIDKYLEEEGWNKDVEEEDKIEY